MLHVKKLESIQLQHSSVVTIGVFDGLHLGHQQLIQQLVETAHRSSMQAVVLTFFPHPDVVLRGIENRYYLMTPETRARMLGEMGVDVVVTMTFDEHLRTVRASDFVAGLVNNLQMTALWVGSDFALGYKREGNVQFLTQYGEKTGFIVRPIDLVSHNEHGEHVSSSSIRHYLEAGAVENAAQLLGRSYEVEGEVVRGDRRGHMIGFPTANLAVWEQQVLPSYGVYAGWVQLGDERFMAVTNVGVRPTFDGTAVTVEPHILDFDREIYGETLTLSFEKRLRGEKKFDGIEALKAQLKQDIAEGRAFLESMG